MTCRECREKWSALLDSELTPSEIKAVWGHIRECPDCCKYCCELTCLDAIVRHLNLPAASEALWQRLRAKLPALRARRLPLRKLAIPQPAFSRMGRM
ncbi:anti-sigma factor family protein [Fervidibacter sacchari]